LGGPAVTPANIKVDGVPAVTDEIAHVLAPYSEYRAAGLMDWHPVRREMLIQTRFGNVPQIHRVRTPGGDRSQITFLTEPIGYASYRPGSSGSYVFVTDTGGNEFFQIYYHDGHQTQARLLTDGKSRNGEPIWSNKGNQLAYSSTRRNGRDSDIYITDPDKTEASQLVMQADNPGWFVCDWAPDDSRLLVRRRISISESQLYEVDISSGARKPVFDEHPKASFEGAVYSKDGKSLYFATDERSDFLRLARMDLQSRRIEFLRPDIRWDIEALALSNDGNLLAYQVNEDGFDRIYVLDTATGRDVVLPALPTGVIPPRVGRGKLIWHPNSRELAFTTSSSSSPGDVYSVDVQSRQLHRWTESETGGLNPTKFAVPALIRWKSFDGLPISGLSYVPPKQFTGRRPVLIEIHGGPEGQAKADYLRGMNYFVNELGITIIRPNVRGSMGYGKRFVAADNGKLREDSVKDIGALLDWIAMQPELDASRVMVMGGSYGGYMTLASMARFSDRLRCGVDIVGIANWVTFLERTEAYRRDLRRVEYGDERIPEMRDFLSTISPVNHAHKIVKPMLIIQGKNDPRVPYTESEQMVAAIRKNQGKVWYVLASDEGHGFRKKANRDYQMAAIALFVKQHLVN
jgi:dipeptidyl aminopeptidase/acylaminoacyl peptidase